MRWCTVSLALPDPLFARRLSIDNFKCLASRGSGIVRIASCSDTLSFSWNTWLTFIIPGHIVNSNEQIPFSVVNPQCDVVWWKLTRYQVHYHPEKTQGVRITLLFELYQTLSQLGAYNYHPIVNKLTHMSKCSFVLGQYCTLLLQLKIGCDIIHFENILVPVFIAINFVTCYCFNS